MSLLSTGSEDEGEDPAVERGGLLVVGGQR